MSSMHNADSMMENIRNFSIERFNNDGQILQMFLAYHKDSDGRDVLAVIPGGWSDLDERAFVLSAIRAYFREHGVTCYGVMSEVWYKSMSPEQLKDRGNKLIQDFEDKKEGLMAMAVDEDGAQHVVYEIVRPFDGSKPYLGEVVQSLRGEQVSGDLASLLQY